MNYGPRTIYVFHIGEDNAFEWTTSKVYGSVPMTITYEQHAELENMQHMFNRWQDKFKRVVEETDNG